jgi:hypothetical protein
VKRPPPPQLLAEDEPADEPPDATRLEKVEIFLRVWGLPQCGQTGTWAVWTKAVSFSKVLQQASQ